MSINNYSNFNMPSLSGLVDINADSVNSTTIESQEISSNNVDTQTLIVDGVDLGQQVNLNAQKLTAITYTATPTPTTNLVCNTDVTGTLYIRDPTDPNVYMRIYYEPSLYGMTFSQEVAGRYMNFRIKNASGTGYSMFYFSQGQLYASMGCYFDNWVNVAWNKDLTFGDNNGSNWYGGRIKYIPNSSPANGWVFFNKGVNTQYYTNFTHNDLTNTEVPTLRMNYNNIWSKVPHTFENSLIGQDASFNTTLSVGSTSNLKTINGTSLNISGSSNFSNTIVADSLSVINGTNLNGDLTAISKSQFIGVSTFQNNLIGNANIHASTFDVSGNSIFNGSSTNYGNTYFNNDIYLQVSSKLFAYGTGITQQELSYLSGVTSAIQTQLNNKLSLTGGSVTGNLNVSGNINVYGTGTNTIYGTNSIVGSTTFNSALAVNNQLNLTYTGTSGLNLNNNIIQTGYDASHNRITQNIISGDVVNNHNTFKYSKFIQDTGGTTTVSPCIALSEQTSANSMYFFAKSGGGAYNDLTGASDRLICSFYPQNANALTITSWATLKLGLRISTTSATNAQAELWAGSTNSIVLNNSTGINITSDKLNLTNTSTTTTTNHKALSHTFTKADGTDGTSVVVRGNLSLPVASTGITFPDSTVQNTAYTNAKDTTLTSLSSNLGGITNANLTPNYVLVTATLYNAGSIVLLPGTYIITVNGCVNLNGNTIVGSIATSYSNSPSSLSQTTNLAIIHAGNIAYGAGNQWILATTGIVSHSVTTEYYLVISANFGTATRANFIGTNSCLKAVRII